MNVSLGARKLIATTWLGLLLAGCGGGGSSGSNVEATPSNPPVTGTTPPPTTTPSTEFLLYEDLTAAKFLKGPLDGSSSQPFADYDNREQTWSRFASGKQLGIFRPASSTTRTLSVYDTSSGQVVLTQDVPRNSVVAGPVFGNADHYVLRTFEGTSDGNKAFVVNLKTGTVVDTLTSGGFDTTIDALPDGRLYRIHDKTGAISTSGANGAWTDIGQLSIPTGWQITGWRLNHQGTKVAINYTFTGTAERKSDVWVANIDGSAQSRLTSQGDMNHPVWSPDDSQIAFLYDTLSRLGATTGHCSYWQVAADARDIAGIVHDQPHATARQMRVNMGGIKDFSACNIVAWEK